MNIKVFNIRLDKENCQNDQNSMNEFLVSIKVKSISTNFITNATSDFWSVIVFYKEKKNISSSIDESKLTNNEIEVYSSLKQWRNDLAKKQGWSAFRICHNSHLLSIAKLKPQNLEELKNIRNFGESRILNYGDDIIALLNSI